MIYIYIYSQMLFQMAKLTKTIPININPKYKNDLKYVEPRYAAIKLLPRNACGKFKFKAPTVKIIIV